MVQIGSKIIFGVGDKDCPPLPAGFTLKEEIHKPAIAIRDDGKRFIIVLKPPSLIPILSEVGNTTRADFDNPILLA